MKKILVVEDDEIGIFLLKHILRHLKFKESDIIYTSNGDESIEIFKDKIDDIGLVLLDIRILGSKNGFEVLEIMRKMNKDIPIIIETAQSMYASVQKGEELGCTEYICKPFNTNEFINIIKKYIELF